MMIIQDNPAVGQILTLLNLWGKEFLCRPVNWSKPW